MAILGWVLLTFAFLSCSATVRADQYEMARQWLERMAVAMKELSYQGTFVYLQGEDVETLRITHVRDESGRRERLVALSGPRREIIRDADGVRCLLEEADQELADPALVGGTVFPEFPPEALLEARGRYLFQVGQSGRIAGRTGRRISIVPKDRYRYGYELWLEEETALILRWVLYDGQRRALARLMFTDLSTGSEVDPEELEPSGPKERFVAVARRDGTAGLPAPDQTVAAPEGVPPGFRLAAHRSGPDGSFEHLVYSDGLATVSVYIERPDPVAPATPGWSRMGATNAWSRASEQRLVTAIGEVPPVTVRQFGDAFSLAAK